MTKSCTCIIPFYNEKDWIIDVLSKITQISKFDKIILVDDGSTDDTFDVARNFIKNNKFENIEIVSYKTNKWKSQAIYEWLKIVETDYVFLFDADLKKVKIDEVIRVIDSMYENETIDMWMLRRVLSKWYIKLLYRELILSGQRMLRKEDLLEVFKEKFDRYQLEIAINTYMHKNKKIVVRYPFSAENTFKSQKRWFWGGWRRDMLMFRDIFKYQGFFFYIKHSFSFNPYSLEKYNKLKKRS